MHTIRRGGPAAAAGVPRATSESSQGRASETPAARRKRRRLSFTGNPHEVSVLGASRRRLGALETVLLADRVRQRPQDPAVLQEDGLDASETLGDKAVSLNLFGLEFGEPGIGFGHPGH